ncbi:hypothetical protein NOV72_03827 [Caballeronia novacaledonica]|uniref:Lipoprotein n=2 Tax=Caballeronia novacaledonica TaxID=1544861 RepID=A0A2U3I8Z8_9BURK|nr:hypothetical protein NOV72_03827 [Caballeronia novacaledonica]
MLKSIFLPVVVVLAACQQAGLEGRGCQDEVLFSTTWKSGIPEVLEREALDGAIRVIKLNDVDLPQALEVTIGRNDDYRGITNGVPRAEISFSKVATFRRGVEYIVDWQTYFPDDFSVDSKQPEVISQIHQGEHAGFPTFALFITERGEYAVRTRSGDGRPSMGARFGRVAEDKGRVVNWRLRYIPDDSGKVAVTELSKNEKIVFAANRAPNAYPSDDDAYFKIGLYKSAWQKKPSDVETRTLYYGPLSIRRAD